MIKITNQREVDLDALLHGRVGEALGDASPMGLIGDLPADLGQVVLAVGVLHVGQQLRPFAHQAHPPAQQVAGGAHLRWINISQREVPTAQQMCDLVGIDLVVLGFAAVDRLHIQRMAEHELDLLGGTEIGEPVPAEDAFHADDQVRSIWGDRLQERLGRRRHVPM